MSITSIISSVITSIIYMAIIYVLVPSLTSVPSLYFLTRNFCLKQYARQTVEKFRYRWKNYKNSGRKYQEYCPCMQQHLFEVFFFEEQTIVFCNIPLLHWLTKLTHQRENFWRSTMALWRLNVEDCAWNSVLLYSYHWIYMDCNKDLIYGNFFGADYYCYYFYHYHCCCHLY